MADEAPEPKQQDANYYPSETKPNPEQVQVEQERHAHPGPLERSKPK